MLDDRKKCLETRLTAEGFVRRRYAMNDGTRLTTYEVPSAVFRGMSRAGLARQMQAAKNGSDIRAVAESRRTIVRTMKARGEPTTAIAAALGITEARVRQIVKNLHHTDSDK